MLFTSGEDLGRGTEDKFVVFVADVLMVHPDDTVFLRVKVPHGGDFEREVVQYSSAPAGTFHAIGHWTWAVPESHPRICMPPKRPPSGDWMLGLRDDT